MRAVRAWFLFLSPHSPDLRGLPPEKWSSLK